MTCIVAIAEKDKIWMGCDSLMSTGDGASLIDSKVVKKDNIIMGFAGRVRDINLIRFGFEIPKQEKRIDDYEYMATVFTTAVRERLKEYGAAKITNHEELGQAQILIGYNQRLYNMNSDFALYRVEDTTFAAIGSGEKIALGSLYSTQSSSLKADEKITLALKAAEKFTRSVRGPFVVECLEA